MPNAISHIITRK